MKAIHQQLQEAVDAGLLLPQQQEPLARFLRQHPLNQPALTGTQVLYYLGGLLAIGAMTLLMTLGWESFGGWAIFAISIAYAIAGLWLTRRFARQQLTVPASLCATFVVALTPLAIYGLQNGLGFWPDGSEYREYHHYLRWHWLYMELGTLVSGMVLARHYRYPFMMMPVAVTLWYMSMDLADMLYQWNQNLNDDYYAYSFTLRAIVSMYFGLLMTLLAFWVDLHSRKGPDFAWWLYLFGVLAFWSGLTVQHSDSELAKAGYLLINLLMISAGTVLQRKVFVVFGGFGCAAYLGHLAWDVFENSWLFPIVLTLLGLGLIYAGILWARYSQQLTRYLQRYLPTSLRELLESRQPY